MAPLAALLDTTAPLFDNELMDTAVWTAGALVSQIIPKARGELAHWRERALLIPSATLRKQALDSIASKAFHVFGGSVYALYPNRRARQYRQNILRAIAAIQTISDYLDNLCDRAGESDERAFRQLHMAMLDALDAGARWQGERGESDPATDTAHAPSIYQNAQSPSSEPYYQEYPHREDNGYLAELVQVCRTNLSVLPGYDLVRPYALDLARLYCDLQSLKHLDPSVRHRRLEEWATANLRTSPATLHLGPSGALEWWEFAAATGSTLGLFMLFALAAEGVTANCTIERVVHAYFPSITGLHILLDYLIDLEEDRTHGDFNFVACYCDSRYRHERLAAFVREAVDKAHSLPRSGFHLTVIRGLLALYLSDPKVKAGGLADEAGRLCRTAGGLTPLMRQTCAGLRWLGVF
jgi:tetraprenyl-beta-curcumene synthase